MPPAGGPVAFSILALSLTGDVRGGATLMLAMTLAQIAGAIPITRLGRHFPPSAFLRLLIVIRTLALVALALCAQVGIPFAWLVFCAAFAGSVNGAAFGFLRAMLNSVTSASKLPRALGISATPNEVSFVLAPVAASGLSTVSPVLSLVVLASIGAVPALAIADAGAKPVKHAPAPSRLRLNRSVLLWLCCAAASGAAVAGIEIGAVALALDYGYSPALAILFTVPLCLASVAGGIWVSVRNRMASRRAVVAQLSVMALGSAFVAFGPSIAVTIAGTVLTGLMLAPLSTCYTLVMDGLAPTHRRPEMFAMLRTANALGLIVVSAAIAMLSLSFALILTTAAMALAAVIVAITHESASVPVLDEGTPDASGQKT